jgi:2-polyprenyl-3-methyl-5-hydroxy-6-metoxy-1,4-benzoquinol methylase
MGALDKPVQFTLSAELRSILRCTGCRAPLDEVAEAFVCTRCGSRFPLVRGVYRFADEQNYAASFGWQWRRYSRTQLDTTGSISDEDFRKRTGIAPDELRGKLVLDVGCGMGRFAEVAARWGARVVGVDLSDSCEVAAENLAEREFVALQADAMNLPFAPETFDFIYSIGVLHHTPDCEGSFKRLPKYLKPGGTIAVWLYSGYNKWYRFSDLYRKFTRRMSPRRLHSILKLAVPCFYSLDRIMRAIPVIGRRVAGLVHYVFPVNLNPNPEIRLLDTFDWYSPEYQSKHTYEEVFRWCESCGLEALTVGELTLSVRGRKPAGRNSELTEMEYKHSADCEMPIA